jgi:hypothetical protein
MSKFYNGNLINRAFIESQLLLATGTKDANGKLLIEGTGDITIPFIAYHILVDCDKVKTHKMYCAMIKATGRSLCTKTLRDGMNAMLAENGYAFAPKTDKLDALLAEID